MCFRNAFVYKYSDGKVGVLFSDGSGTVFGFTGFVSEEAAERFILDTHRHLEIEDGEGLIKK